MSAPRTTLRRLADRIAGPYIARLERRLSELSAELRGVREENFKIMQALRIVSYDEPANRRRLYAMRHDPSYELAFKEREPLVSFVVATYDNYEALRDVSLPAILGQTYTNLEAIVIGDGAPPQTADAIASIDDPRVTYFNRSFRGPYGGNARERWLASGTPAFNEGLFRARGRWIAPMADDDAARPDHTRTLVEEAQRHGYEACYGAMAVHFRDGRTCELGEFPPRLGSMGLQATLYHGGLRFLHQELIDPVFGESNDWSMTRRMMRLGVYIGMVDAVVTDKHEAKQTFEDYLWLEPRPVS
jgi:hypothetical protein